MSTTIRPLRAPDQAEWRRLWTGYLEYYQTSVTEEVYQTTFARLLGNDPQDFHGLVECFGISWRRRLTKFSLRLQPIRQPALDRGWWQQTLCHRAL